MLIHDLPSFTTAAKGRLCALDHGTKTIGIAISDANWGLASPVTTIKRTQFAHDMKELMKILEQRGVGGLVIGYPLNMDGTEGARCQSVRAFVRNLEEYTELPMLLWDERLSSSAAEDAMIEAGLNHTTRKDKRDAAAATLILQGMLDRLNI